MITKIKVKGILSKWNSYAAFKSVRLQNGNVLLRKLFKGPKPVTNFYWRILCEDNNVYLESVRETKLMCLNSLFVNQGIFIDNMTACIHWLPEIWRYHFWYFPVSSTPCPNTLNLLKIYEVLSTVTMLSKMEW